MNYKKITLEQLTAINNAAKTIENNNSVEYFFNV